MSQRFCCCINNLTGVLFIGSIPGSIKILLTAYLALNYDWSDIEATVKDVVRFTLIICLPLLVLMDLILVIGGLAKVKCNLVIWMTFSVINLIGAAHILLYGKIWLWASGIVGIVLQVWFTLVVYAAFRDLQEMDSMIRPRTTEAFQI